MSCTVNYWSQINGVKIFPNVIDMGNKNCLKHNVFFEK